MKTYTNKSNAKRAAIKATVKGKGISEVEIKANTEKYFTIEGSKEAGFYPHYITERVGVSEEKEVELSESRVSYVQTVGRAKREVTAPIKVVDYANNSIKIEKDRPEQNGIIRPSVGGKCRQVWDFCDTMYAEGVLPMPKHMREWAEQQGVNANNAVIEMYQWRRFNGMVGRQK